MRLLTLVFVTLPVVIADQVSKAWIARAISPFDPLEIIPDFFHITFIRNRGGAFGFLSGIDHSFFQAGFIIATVAAIGFIAVLYAKLHDRQRWPATGMALIIGGAIGNLIDRVRWGSVVDFIDLHIYSHHWPAFNVADSAITVGSVVLGICIVFKKW
ncbi:MAG: signal peptidase II [Candidatus Aminicenantes bacterium]|nr:signal peptidase II [Candidatus Aminicenantes bacterium]